MTDATQTTPTVWPTCPECGDPYSITIGLPVTISAIPKMAELGAVDVDAGDLTDLDDSCAIHCACEADPSEADVETLRVVLAEFQTANECRFSSVVDRRNR